MTPLFTPISCRDISAHLISLKNALIAGSYRYDSIMQHVKLPPSQAGLRVWRQPDLLFPMEYLGFVFISSLDLILTIAILSLGGHELNPIARLVVQEHGPHGMLLFKFAMVVLIVVLCEWVGRIQTNTGQRLAYTCVGITTVPVIWSLFLLTNHIAL